MTILDDLLVVVPIFGRAGLLERCLAALGAAGVSADRIVVVDDASGDAAISAVVRSRGVTLIELVRNAGPAAARNAGVAGMQTGNILFFVDADVLVAPDVIAHLEAAFSDPGLAAVFGCYDAAPAETDLVSLYVNLRHREVHRQSAGPAETFWAGCGAVRRSAFEAVGGFDPSSRWHYIEDVEFGRRLDRAGFGIRLDPALQGKHLKRWTLAGSARTDVLFRARPWVALMLEETRVMRGLNADRAGRLSMVAVAVSGLCLAASLVWWPALILAVVGILIVPILNADLFRSFARQRGLPFMIACVPLHAFHLSCVGIGLTLGLSLHVWRRARRHVG